MIHLYRVSVLPHSSLVVLSEGCHERKHPVQSISHIQIYQTAKTHFGLCSQLNVVVPRNAIVFWK
jgi:hypothetical protein